MEELLSEKQQIEQIRDWFKENAPYAAAGILIGVGGLFGWQQWHAYLDRQSAAASAKYQMVIAALGRGDLDGGTRLARELKDGFGRTPYPDQAALAVASADVQSGKVADAAPLLEQVMTGARDEDLKIVARLRLARVQRALGKPDLALATLAAAPPAAAAAVADVRGDVLADKGDRAGAIAAWRAALADGGPTGVDRELVGLKIAAAGGGAPPPAPTAQAEPAGAGGTP